MNNNYNSLEELLIDYPSLPLGKGKDMTNKTINRITFITRVRPNCNSNSAYWACKCQCGNYFVVRATHVNQGKIKSCGCYSKEINHTATRVYTPNHEDLRGKRYNYLLPIEYIGKDKNNHAIWKCKCECGNIVSVTATHLKTGHTTSCGCSKTSQYEQRVVKWLNEHKMCYNREVKVMELGKLRFDFQVFLPEGNYCFIEVQGQQHFKPSDKFGGEAQFERLKINDEKKIEYCKSKNIPLLLINYNDSFDDKLSSFFL